MSSSTGVLAGLAEIIGAVVGVEAGSIGADDALREDLGVGSLAAVEVVVAAEKRFGVPIPDSRVGDFRTVGDLAAFLEAAGAR